MGRLRARQPGVDGFIHTWWFGGEKDLSCLERICAVLGDGAVPGRRPQETGVLFLIGWGQGPESS